MRITEDFMLHGIEKILVRAAIENLSIEKIQHMKMIFYYSKPKEKDIM